VGLREVFLSVHMLIESKEFLLKKGPNFAVTNKVSNLDMVCVVELARPKLPLSWVWSFVGGVDVCWKNQGH
jgi:hypothetical protein